MIRSTDIKDRDGGVMVVASLPGMLLFLPRLSAESDCGPEIPRRLQSSLSQVDVEIVKGCDAGKFVMPPERWIVGRVIGWLGRCRRLAKDGEWLNQSALAFLL